MKHYVIGTLGLATLIGLAGLASHVGASAHVTERSFPFGGRTLSVRTDDPQVPVWLVANDDPTTSGPEVHVSVVTKAMAAAANPPAVSLKGMTLHLGAPCSAAANSRCKANVTVVVPSGVVVDVNGARAVVADPASLRALLQDRW